MTDAKYFTAHATILYAPRHASDFELLSQFAHIGIAAKVDDLSKDFSLEIDGKSYKTLYELETNGKKIFAPNGFSKKIDKDSQGLVIASMLFSRWVFEKSKKRSKNNNG